MRTTLVIDDDLYRRAKAKAALEGKSVTSLVEQALRAVVDGRIPAEETKYHARLPLIGGGHPADPAEELTAERVAEILLGQDVEWQRDSLRR